MPEMAAIDRLAPRQRRAIPALLVAPSIKKAAEVAKVPERTLRRWLAEDALFKQALADALAEVRASTKRRLLSAEARALAVLEKHLVDVDGHIAVRAARAILDNAARAREEETVERVLALEARLDNETQPYPATET